MSTAAPPLIRRLTFDLRGHAGLVAQNQSKRHPSYRCAVLSAYLLLVQSGRSFALDRPLPAEDPVSRTHPKQTTADWPANPSPDPESSLVGTVERGPESFSPRPNDASVHVAGPGVGLWDGVIGET